jgi:hypothetical protein
MHSPRKISGIHQEKYLDNTSNSGFFGIPKSITNQLLVLLPPLAFLRLPSSCVPWEVEALSPVRLGNHYAISWKNGNSILKNRYK